MTTTPLCPLLTDLLDRHRPPRRTPSRRCAHRTFYSAFDEVPSPRVYGEAAAAQPGRVRAVARGGVPAQHAGCVRTVATERSPCGLRPRCLLPAGPRTSTRCCRRRAAACRPGATPVPTAGRGVPGDPRPAARASSSRQRGAAHQRPGVRDGLPGRWRPRWTGRWSRSPTRGPRCTAPRRPRSGRSPGAASRCGWRDVHGRAARVARWSSAATPSRPGTPGPACSPRWSPATRWSSNRTHAGACRSRSPYGSARRCWSRRASTPTW